MKKQIRGCILQLVALLLAPVATLYVDCFNILVILAIAFNLVVARKEFIGNLKESNLYLKLPLILLVYLLLHTVFLKLFGNEEARYSFSIFESLGLYFIALPLYLFSGRDLLEEPRLFKRVLLCFMYGVIIFNTAAFFKLAGLELFSDPFGAIGRLAASRFGGNKEIFGGFIFLEPQALYINLAAIIALYWSTFSTNVRQKIGFIVLFMLLLFFLILTETKSAYISFIAGFCVWLFFFFKKRNWKFRLKYSCVIVVSLCLLLWCMPDSMKLRMKQAQTELNNALNDDLAGGGTIMPRVALYKVNFSHFREFGLWGLGVAYTNTVRQWYDDSAYRLAHLNDPHNSFMFFWLIGGVVGLLFVLALFALPLWYMLRKKQFSYMAFAFWMMLFIANNTTVLLSLNDSKPLILFFLTLILLKNDQLRRWENEYFLH
ncbi:MAG: O-antigen ligase family protein [Odoribacter sp.]|nr:O-antigen ligase family protein [Odoribacter sp.]